MTLEIHGLEENLDPEEDAAAREPFLGRPQNVESLDGNTGENVLPERDSSSLTCSVPLMDILVHRQSSKDTECDSPNFEQPQCRICLDVGGDDLIAPCQCRGTQKFVHRSCLDIWRAAKEGFAFAHCTECRAPFCLRANVPPDRWWLRLKFQLLVLRDHAAIFVVVQLVVASLGFLVYSSYGDELKEMFGYEHHPFGFYTLAVLHMLVFGGMVWCNALEISYCYSLGGVALCILHCHYMWSENQQSPLSCSGKTRVDKGIYCAESP